VGKESLDLKLIFCNTLEKAGDQERQAYLDEVCKDNPDLRDKLEELLALHDQADGFLEVPAAEVTLDGSPLLEGPGTVIGPYKLLEKIGEGGMAVVYMAEQERPLRRRVALKIIKLGMDTKEVTARFEAERQALALMDHPCIAKVFDAGATDTGRPFFVMELVQGISITQYCDQNKLRPKDRLELFMQVCQAVQHAHQKGIIHRDIKPANVMVTTHDGEPVPKVIDFGIAKATKQRLTERTMFTRYAHIIGTPAYMSPEQAELGDMDIDTRSDIYSLGVLLYELLVGTTPLSEEELRRAGYLEMQRIIREQEPSKPSTKLSTLGDTVTEIARHRNVSPDVLTKTIRGDLDWIVMKALDKSRDRRYDNASAFALDVQRHLNSQAVSARAPSTLYLMQTFLRRHPSQVAVSLVTLPLLLTLIVTLLLWNRGRLERLRNEASSDASTLAQVNRWMERNDLKRARQSLETLVSSQHVGTEVRRLRAQILSDIHEQIRQCTDRITNEPKDASNFLRRAQSFHQLGDTEKALADMDRYVTLLYPREFLKRPDHPLYDLLRRLWRSTPVNLGKSINASLDDWAPSVSSDGLSLLFFSQRALTLRQDRNLWISTRRTVSDAWGIAEALGPPVDGRALDGAPNLAADGLTLYFMSAVSTYELCMSTRPSTEDQWEAPVELGPPINSWAREIGPAVSTDGLELFFSSDRPVEKALGDDDIYVSTRPSTDAPWGTPVNLGATVNSQVAEAYVSLAAADLLLFFCSFRETGSGATDIWVSARATKADPWGSALNLGPTINSPYYDGNLRVSADCNTFYLSTSRPGGQGWLDIWQGAIVSTPSELPKDKGKDGVATPAPGHKRTEE